MLLDKRRFTELKSVMILTIIIISDDITVIECNLKRCQATIKITVIEQRPDTNDGMNNCVDDDENWRCSITVIFYRDLAAFYIMSDVMLIRMHN